MTWHIDVPATLSNLGPGFDVLGMAIDRHNRFSFEPRGDAGEFWDQQRAMGPTDHVVPATIAAAERAFGVSMPHGLSLEQHEVIPRNRGQGSSATARVAGLMAWKHFSGADVSCHDALQLLTELEGHADNAAAALHGGVTAARIDATGVHVARFEAPSWLKVVVCVPEVEVSTDDARKALPGDYALPDVVTTLSSLSWLMHGLLTGDRASLRAGMTDQVHHPYRGPLIGPVDEVIDAALGAGAISAFISGSGSTLAAFVDADGEAVAAAMCARLKAAGIAASADVVGPRSAGAWTTLPE